VPCSRRFCRETPWRPQRRHAEDAIDAGFFDRCRRYKPKKCYVAGLLEPATQLTLANGEASQPEASWFAATCARSS
jgi:hypothetical protein